MIWWAAGANRQWVMDALSEGAHPLILESFNDRDSLSTRAEDDHP